MMKKVIFICLLSLTTCLSRPNDTPVDTGAPVAPAANLANANLTTPADSSPASVKDQAPNGTATSLTPASANNSAPAETPATTPAAAPAATNATIPPPADAKANTTTVAPPTTSPPNGTKVETTTTTPDKGDKLTTTKPSNSVPDDKKKGEDKTTPATPSQTTKPVEAAGRGFDGPSFLGGMILTLGLLAIGFMGFKYYRNQTERNYHTL